MNKKIKEKIKNAPDMPGVYLFSKKGKNLYIGKAKSLKKRLLSYIKASEKNPKILYMTVLSDHLNYITVRTEKDALMLEYKLIKKYKPKFNILYADDKKYPYLKITNELFPKIIITRNKIKDNAVYFGPYSPGVAFKKNLSKIRMLFPVRNCNLKLKEKNNKKICMQYHLKLCPGPCENLISPENYNKNVASLKQFLNGQYKNISWEIKQSMLKESNELNFEKAALLRDKLFFIEKLMQKYNVISDLKEADIICSLKLKNSYIFNILNIRDCTIISSNNFTLKGNLIDIEQLYEQFILNYYSNRDFIPEKIIFDKKFDLYYINLFFKSFNKKIKSLYNPKKYKSLIDISYGNLNTFIQTQILKNKQKNINILFHIKDFFKLSSVPEYIEGYDVSVLTDKFPVASMVPYINGVYDKALFRIYNIDEDYISDTDRIFYVIAKRFSKHLKENRRIPDLIFIDGGKPQISAVKKALSTLNIKNIPVIGLAKKEEILIYKNKEFKLDKTSEILKFFQRLRDTCHKKAIEYHKKKRNKIAVKSSLLNIKGVGEKTLKKIQKIIINSKNKIELENKIAKLKLNKKIKGEILKKI